jgi:hypothetical protein
MKKALLGLMTASLLVSPLGLAAAQAEQTAPAAKAAVEQARGFFCLPNVDNDNHVLCVAARPEQENCRQTFQILIVSYWTCGVNNPPPTPGGCINLDNDENFLCLGRAKPSGTCRENIGLIIVHNYHCMQSGRRIGL